MVRIEEAVDKIGRVLGQIVVRLQIASVLQLQDKTVKGWHVVPEIVQQIVSRDLCLRSYVLDYAIGKTASWLY